ncbi:Inner dynein arm light chain, axonemal-related protein [Trichomonas vaginalis G3]|uniref:Inner dynein arm light chain, axonemal-related protein n=1 Tax=Trichomonas vaginalis (strain ATCC PRA-98 / G3) TaxID=412133 RepID=A2DE76_TRIV3|nr:dynein heavy chain binding [Trichomonas vaginalis G3]EAY21294.1 Inner dynein arm light chain, axonemal-related protein [Trichomonas vaginalis G3]KAI5548868.1 dynein heavy chain binding [Trichomonas vaginalis G3]|eukprot:XP_001582280.1 Inner dynein arm light chain, axonemal-related protein [Trichomonas vaginalis G3]
MQEVSLPTLVKYDAPVPVDEPDTLKRSRTNAVAGVDGDQINRDVLNSLFPPIEFEQDEIKYTRSISTAPISKTDVTKLRTELDTLLHKNKTKPKGIDIIRSELYSQCFEEVIRQVTIDSNARGRLLFRIRNHYKTLIQSYKDLNELALNFGANKNIQVTLGMDQLLDYNKKLREKRRELELEANNLQIQLDGLEKRIQENKQIREKEFADEIAFLKKQGQSIKMIYDQCQNRPP